MKPSVLYTSSRLLVWGVIAATVVVAFAAMAASGVAKGRLLLKRVPLKTLSSLPAPNAARVTMRGLIALPSDWAIQSNTSKGIVARDSRYPSCRFTIRIIGLASRSDDATAQARLATVMRAPARWVLDSGTRGRGVWNVVRIPGNSSNGVELEGVLVLPLNNSRAQTPGLKSWSELHVTAKARAGSECHSGMYRQAVGPMIGDALATYRGNVLVDAP